jgi:phosphate/sulfate permease
MTLLIIIIALALIFDYINGFHDSANSIATIVSTKVLTPFQAVIWAAFFNVLAFWIFKDHAVANSISKTVHQEFITLPVILSGLLAAIFWNLLTWWYGIPSSSSHTLIGGFAGAAIAHALTTKGIGFSWSKIVDAEILLAEVVIQTDAAVASLVSIAREKLENGLNVQSLSEENLWTKLTSLAATSNEAIETSAKNIWKK